MKEKLLLIVIFALALFLRLYKLAQVPPGLNRDEAAIGYTAYSLIQTGKDEYGKSWPLSFKSFGDWKVPVYFYLTIPFVLTFGLTEFSARLPSALFGSFTVVLTYFLIKGFLEHNDKDADNSKKENNVLFINKVSLVGALLFAISPWSLFMSRNASESNLAVFFVTLGLVLFFKSFKKPFLIILSFIMLALSLFTYHGDHVFTPLLFIGICAIYWQDLRSSKWFIYGVGAFVVLAVIIFNQTLFIADRTKISGLFPTSDVSKVYENVVLTRLEHSKITFLVRFLHSPFVYVTRTVVENYLKGFSPEFLFISGGKNSQHNIPGFGNLYAWEGLILPLAVCFVFSSKKKYRWFLLLWLLLSSLPASITRDAPHTNRMMVFLPLPAILSAYGLTKLFYWFSLRRIRLLGLFMMTLIVGINFVVYLDQYYTHFPYLSAVAWGNGYKEMVQKLLQYKNDYKEIFIARPDYSPYIYYLFYAKSDPANVQKNIMRYPPTDEGFEHVREFDGIVYRKIDWASDLNTPNRLFIDWASSIPPGATNSATRINQQNNSDYEVLQGNPATGSETFIVTRLIDQVLNPDGTPLFYFIDTRLVTPRKKSNQ